MCSLQWMRPGVCKDKPWPRGHVTRNYSPHLPLMSLACLWRTQYCQGPSWGGVSCAPHVHVGGWSTQAWLPISRLISSSAAQGWAGWCMWEAVVKDDHPSHAALMLPGKWTLASQGSSWELNEWRCSGGESSWSPKGLAAQLEDHTGTHTHTGTLHTPHTCACHRQTTYKHTSCITRVYTHHSTTPMYTYAHHTHLMHAPSIYITNMYLHGTHTYHRQATDTYTHISHKCICAMWTTHHTYVYIPHAQKHAPTSLHCC